VTSIQNPKSKIQNPDDFTQKLQDLMQRVEISSFKALSRAAGVSEHQILRLRQLGVQQMRLDVLLKFSQALKVSLHELISNFSHVEFVKDAEPQNQELLQQIAQIKKEYDRLQDQFQQQRQLTTQEFMQSSLQLLESLLIQFPTAAYKAKENTQLTAVKILPLIQKPLDKLLQQWGVEAIAPVGVELPYDPQLHQLMEGNAQPGEIVKIRYTGYRQGDKLLYRAKVSPLTASSEQ
jgi:molecular chaperone GrpE (heat shock protein)